MRWPSPSSRPCAAWCAWRRSGTRVTTVCWRTSSSLSQVWSAGCGGLVSLHFTSPSLHSSSSPAAAAPDPRPSSAGSWGAAGADRDLKHQSRLTLRHTPRLSPTHPEVPLTTQSTVYSLPTTLRPAPACQTLAQLIGDIQKIIVMLLDSVGLH